MKILYRTQAVLLVLGAACGSAAAPPALGGEQFYYFIDERGVHHYSNVPADPRYRPLPGIVGLSSQQPKGGVAPMPLQNGEMAPLLDNEGLPVEPAPFDDPSVAMPEDLPIPENGEALPEELGVEEDTQQILIPGEPIEPQDQ
jgi:hypothetical protein